ncbi:hypothetical protein Glove_216g117 [Diversispora epigaea]|uniref:Uncharacterized protein n=1 Tax=Diversispora epigaea TaxID=1348612 RepID=A0A397IKC9_9GLOM|nr:hypothetical protein Glove_216g117 [Diversispora epigaea]
MNMQQPSRFEGHTRPVTLDDNDRKYNIETNKRKKDKKINLASIKYQQKDRKDEKSEKKFWGKRVKSELI